MEYRYAEVYCMDAHITDLQDKALTHSCHINITYIDT